MNLNEFEVISTRFDHSDIPPGTSCHDEEDFFYFTPSFLDFAYEGRTYKLVGLHGTNEVDCLRFSDYYSAYGTVCKQLYEQHFDWTCYSSCEALCLSFEHSNNFAPEIPWFFYRLPLLAKFFCKKFGGLKRILYGLHCFEGNNFPVYRMLEDSLYDTLLSPFAVLLNDGSVFCYDASELLSGVESNHNLAVGLKDFALCFEGKFNASQIIIDKADYSDQLSLRWDKEALVKSYCSILSQEKGYESVDDFCVGEVVLSAINYIYNKGKFFLNLDQFELYSRRSLWGEWRDRSYKAYFDMCLANSGIHEDEPSRIWLAWRQRNIREDAARFAAEFGLGKVDINSSASFNELVVRLTDDDEDDVEDDDGALWID